MADTKKKTQAQRAASRNGSRSGGNQKKTGKAASKPEKSRIQIFFEELPPRFISASIGLAVFVLFLVMFLTPEGEIGGVLLSALRDLVKGMIGNVAFIVSIPALLFFFIIQAFSGSRPVKMRSWSLLAFVLISGCLSYFFVEEPALGSGFAFIGDLYMGGIQGTTPGLLCGSVSVLLSALLTDVLSTIILVVAAVFTLLGSMQITIPSIIRAVQNRPRADWEEEELEQRQEPAAVVVNHLATKRIEHIEKKRQARQAQIDMPLDGEAPIEKPKRKAKPEAEELMRQIDTDVDTPVSAAEEYVAEPADDSIFTPIGTPKKKLTENIPHEMPVLDMDTIPKGAVPVVEETPAPAPKQEAVPAKVTAKDAQQSAAQVAKEIEQNAQQPTPQYCFPPIDLLKKPGGGALDGTAEMRENTRRLNEALESFRIEAHIINVTRGPSVTRYEVELDRGVRLNKLTAVADDIALSLGASGVRIAAVPGRISVVGIEVPNRAVSTVSLREVIDSPEFTRAKSKSTFAVGKDIGGSCIVGNIAKLPHMLIAGTTGSGKSVCMNSIIISLLYKSSPDDVKLIMIDPKMVELGIYNSIPHLLIPVVTDPKKAAGSLQWAVSEMMRRYKAMSDAGVRDMDSYNAIMEHEGGNKLPQVVVIIDELADLMLVAAKEVEESICRIAQMGRASGIHLIIATQRPSADVITGLMKANIPSRIAFSVASAMESRIILDTQGAEKLVGKGDMLFAPIGSGKPLRVQGCFVSDAEVEAVATYVKDNFNSNYDPKVLEEIEKKAAQTGSKTPTASDPEPNDCELGGDEMLPDAVDIILETGQASISMLQRRLKLGYARAARIVDEMEEMGIVGPTQGSKPRNILITKEKWEAMRTGQPKQITMDELEEADDAPFEDDV